MRASDLTAGTVDRLKSAGAYLSDLATPSIRLGVTGLARSGKTVFITALVRSLVSGGRLPFFRAQAEDRILRVYLEPQPDDAVPRFDYEAHLAALGHDPPEWPDGTRRLSQLRVTLEYLPASRLRRALGPGRLHLDIVDYPGEWLLDLGLLEQSYADWSRQAIAMAKEEPRRAAAGPWLAILAELDPTAPADEHNARAAAARFTAYLQAARAADPALSTIGPGRFLMPGDLAGSPLITFAPLDMPADRGPARGSLGGMMARRYESYRSHIVKPFFRDHFSRLDRQIVLVDALAALNSGQPALADLTRALDAALGALRPGRRSWLSSILTRRIDRLVFAATKADHLPQTSHDRLEAALRLVIERPLARANLAGAEVRTMALAALRATREVVARHGTERLACIIGVPLGGERIGGREFDGRTEAAIFPGDLPSGPLAAWQGAGSDVRFIRFRPPLLDLDGDSPAPRPWPHVRLDRALEFLIGDRLR